MSPESDLKSLLQSATNAQVSLALYDLASDTQLMVQPDVPFHPASTFKLGVMMEVFHQEAQGLLSLDDRILVKNSFSSIADQSEFSLSSEDDSDKELYQQIGKRLPLRELNRRMIVYSSNLATNLLIEKVEADKVTHFMQELGAKDLVIRRGPEDNKAYALGLNNSATARSLMQVLVRLAKRSVVSPEASDEMIAILRQQYYNEGIPANLPESVSVAHKTGWNDKLYHDAAIVYPPGRKPYVLVVMTSGLPEATEAPALVKALSQAIYHQLATSQEG
jgi:beta-lactamase class A